MDILHLVDRLEELFNNSKPIPLSRNVVVDENSFMDIIDQMRISIPDEIKKAQQVIAQKDRILAHNRPRVRRRAAYEGNIHSGRKNSSFRDQQLSRYWQ